MPIPHYLCEGIFVNCVSVCRAQTLEHDFFFLCFVTLTCKSNLCSPFQVSLVQTLPQKGWCPLSVKKDKWQCRCAWVSFTKTKHSWENTHRLKHLLIYEAVHSHEEVFFFFFFKKHYLNQTLSMAVYRNSTAAQGNPLYKNFLEFFFYCLSLSVQLILKTRNWGCRHLSVENK